MKKPRLEMIDYVTTVPAPVEAVFRRFGDVREWPSWVGPIERSRVRGGGEMKPGARVEFVTDLLPWKVPLGAQVLRFEPNELVEWGIVSRLGQVIHRFEFSPAGASSCTVRHVEFGDGVFALLLRPLAARITRFDRRWADDLVAAFAA